MAGVNRDDLAAQTARMYRVALRILGNHHTAEEIVQDVCVRILQKGPALELQDNVQLSSYLHRATVNCAVDRLRREKLESETLREIDAGIVHDRVTSPDQNAERKEFFAMAKSLVATLPDDCRMAFILTQLDGYTYDEAAAIEDKPRGTIASRVSRAKSLLLNALSEARI